MFLLPGGRFFVDLLLELLLQMIDIQLGLLEDFNLVGSDNLELPLQLHDLLLEGVDQITPTLVPLLPLLASLLLLDLHAESQQAYA